ncbi:MAG: hypothetical protein H6935_10830 [Thiobacillus sp.]|nr:hypothetical protein [Thiobacillus sp.]
MIKKFSFTLIFLGLILAPGYWIHAKFYTGSQASLLTLAPAESVEGGLPAWRTGPFSLNESMAPTGLILLAQGHFSPNMDDAKPPKDLYTATLYRGEEAAKPLGFALGVKSVSNSNPVFREHLLLMQQVLPGNYRLEINAVNPLVIQIDRMELQVRQNLHEPDPNVVTGGVVLFILGILGLVMS